MEKVIKFISFKLMFLFLTSHFISAQQINLVEAFPETFSQPLGLEYSHEGDPYIYIVRRRGFIDRLNSEMPDQPSEEWLNISSRVQTGGERGLLGLAFHPDYPENETFYLYYTFSGEDEDTYSGLSRFSAPGGVADPDSEERLIEFMQPATNHNGGQLAFGPDGYLYLGTGDGGGGNTENSQNTLYFHGNILRIDVDPETGYDIPSDNPFLGDPEGLDEIYAWGFRNPWRFSFDPVTGYLWVADVGQQTWETIYIVENGKNYGWDIIEGNECFPIGSSCDLTGLETPLFEYRWGEEDTGQSITGGYVYRGSDNPSLYGKYIYGDFISGRIWALEIDHETQEVIENTEIFQDDIMIPSFGIDSSGEIYVLGWGESTPIYRFEPDAGNNPPSSVTLLSPEDESMDVPIDQLLVWEEQEQASGYRVQVASDAEFSGLVVDEDVEETEFEVSDLDYETTYFWCVRASNDAGDGEWSSVWSFTTEQEPLSAPGIVTLLSPEDGAMDVPVSPLLSWEEQVQGTGYRVQVASDTEFSGLVVDEDVEETEFEVSDLDYETTYFWRVRASNDAGDGEWSEVWSFTTEQEPLSAPGIVTLLSPEDGAMDVPVSPLLSWEEQVQGSGYRVQVALDSEFGGIVVDEDVEEAEFFVQQELESNTQYFWRVRAFNEAGNGEWSEIWSFTTEMTTSLSTDELPVKFTLAPSYPNPFNPITTIRYGLPEAAETRLEVYDISGQRVALLVNEHKPAGWHTMTFDASALSSGIYILRLKTNGYLNVQKITLIK